MTDDEALASAALTSLSQTGFDAACWRQRPVRSPHHTASAVALVGGGAPPRPGEISLAHGGVLFLDELPEFARSALESLREPLESGRITISRAARQALFPARFQLVAAMNPCPCGWLGVGDGMHHCRCTPDQVARYQSRISGPLLDRIDLQVEVGAVKPAAMLDRAGDGEASSMIAERVAAARTRQLARQGCVNADLATSGIDTFCPLDAAARQFTEQAAARLRWSGRSLHRVLKAARTIADLEGSTALAMSHLAEAMQLRRGLPAA